MLFAEYTWPDVAMAIVEKVLAPLAGMLVMAGLYWLKLRVLAEKVDKGTAVSAFHTDQLVTVEQKIDDNTKLTQHTLNKVADLTKE